MPTVKTMDELKEEVNRRISMALMGAPLSIAVEELQNSLQENVYDKYKPTRYKRRYDNNGGLMDAENFEIDPQLLVDQQTLYIYDVARGNFSTKSSNYTDELAEAISYGWGEQEEDYEKPRPFFPAAQEALEERKDEIGRAIIDAVRKG